MDDYTILVQTPGGEEEPLRFGKLLMPRRGDELHLKHTKSSDGRWRVAQVIWQHHAMRALTVATLVLEPLA